MAFWPKKPEEWSPQTVRAEPANGFMSSGANVRKADISPFVPTAPKAPTPATLPATRSASPAPVAPIVPQPGKNNAANANALAMQRFGEIVSVFMRSAQHRTLTLADIERLVLPAVATGQFMLAEAEVKATGAKQPVAVVLL